MSITKIICLLLISVYSQNAFCSWFSFWDSRGTADNSPRSSLGRGTVPSSSSSVIVHSDYPEVSSQREAYQRQSQHLREVREKRKEAREKAQAEIRQKEKPGYRSTNDDERIEKKITEKVTRRKEIKKRYSESSSEASDDPFLAEIKTIALALNDASPRGKDKKTAKEFGLASVTEAETAYSSGDTESAEFFISTGKVFLDIALGMNPVTSFAQDLHTLFLSKDASKVDRGIAFFGIVTAGGGSSILKSAKNVNKLFKRSEHLVKDTEIVAALIREGRSKLKANLDLTHGWIKNHKIVKIIDAEVLNLRATKNGMFSSWQSGTDIFHLITQKNEKWARVFGGKAKPDGEWLMRLDAIKGLTGEEIKNKYFLKYAPTHVVDAHVPSGTEMYRGRTAWLDYFGAKKPGTVLEGSVQYQLKNGPLDPKHYKNVRLIEDL